MLLTSVVPECPASSKRCASETMQPLVIRTRRPDRMTSALNLCGQCAGVAWDQLANTPSTPVIDNAVLRNLDADELRRSGCSLCELFLSLVDNFMSTLKTTPPNALRWDVRLYSSVVGLESRLSGPPAGVKFRDCPILSIVPTTEPGQSAQTTEPFCGNHMEALRRAGFFGLTCSSSGEYNVGPRTLLPSSINFDVVEKWLSCCKMTHQSTCGVEHPFTHPDWLRVVDCHSATNSTVDVVAVKDDPDFAYVALSYVWGARPLWSIVASLFQSVFLIIYSVFHSFSLPACRHRSPSSHARTTSPPWPGQRLQLEELPRVVIDAMAVTKALNIRYLWVDRYVSRQPYGASKRRIGNNVNKVPSVSRKSRKRSTTRFAVWTKCTPAPNSRLSPPLDPMPHMAFRASTG